MNFEITQSSAVKLINDKLSKYFNANPQDATTEQLYQCVVMLVRDMLLTLRKDFNLRMNEQKGKRVYYLSIEFLLGRSLKHNLFNMELTEVFEKALDTYGKTLDDLYVMEPDAGLGNGGLGRLAACYMDSLASLDYAVMGCCIRYEYGLFKQKIVDGWQIEFPDNWLPGGEAWLMSRSDRAYDVIFEGKAVERWEDNRIKISYENAVKVKAIGYDMMISGASAKSVGVLRLWRPTPEHAFDMHSFSQGDYEKALLKDSEAEVLGKVLYPTDNHMAGKSLRLKQQYFLVSASIQNIVANHIKNFGSLDTLPDYAAIHINDTHPGFAIPELMRILMDDHGLFWEKAWDITTKTIAYTNHTVLSEALEVWEESLIERRIPRIYKIIEEINKRFCAEAWNRFPGDWATIEKMSIVSHGQIRMANLCIIGSHSVNGVSKLHSEILKESVFSEFYRLNPKKFTNVTNGIAHRRWLNHSNPGLSNLLNDCIGEGYKLNAEKLKNFEKFKDDLTVLKRLEEIKLENKKSFSDIIFKKAGIKICPDSIFDVHAKRLHEYKRQLLNALRVLSLYLDLKDNNNLDIIPHTYIFGAKAAPGYYMAKRIIKLIYDISAKINKEPKIKEKLNVVFLENYCVSLAESMIPATEISEQISLAGKEASGTGNMKFMLNGALTIGTLDGANVEMAEKVGEDNIFIFGLTSREVEKAWTEGYNASKFYTHNLKIQRAVDYLRDGFSDDAFDDIANYLLIENVPDPYMCLADFEAYDNAHKLAQNIY
ncbi:MAG: glycogen/starch/alpha-glucan family phosphorylase, partial [Firmicutes bacterium]|nr:glycogen/starch/alpha-glucan family phosphorylase [Bacillota bacterium]